MLALAVYAPFILNRIIAGPSDLPLANFATVTWCLEALMLIAALWHFYHDN